MSTGCDGVFHYGCLMQLTCRKETRQISVPVPHSSGAAAWMPRQSAGGRFRRQSAAVPRAVGRDACDSRQEWSGMRPLGAINVASLCSAGQSATACRSTLQFVRCVDENATLGSCPSKARYQRELVAPLTLRGAGVALDLAVGPIANRVEQPAGLQRGAGPGPIASTRRCGLRPLWTAGISTSRLYAVASSRTYAFA